MAATLLRGGTCKLYYGDALLDGDTDTPATVTWTEIDLVRDGELDYGLGTIDGTTRANSGFAQYTYDLADPAYTFNIPWSPGDTAFDALYDAMTGRTAIPLAVMDKAITTAGALGVVGNWIVSKFTRAEGQRALKEASVEIKPHSQTDEYEVAGS